MYKVKVYCSLNFNYVKDIICEDQISVPYVPMPVTLAVVFAFIIRCLQRGGGVEHFLIFYSNGNT